MCQDKTVLELGAGGALPSLVTALCGAHQVRHFRPPSKLGLRWPTQVVITDYPDTILLDNIIRNIDHNIPSRIRSRVKTQVSEPKRVNYIPLNAVDLFERVTYGEQIPKNFSDA
ncbi:transmembrane protein, putative [Rhizoctonia solani AG-3 Rhs1AP]|uniref:Transmembrane protein, putative n=1 Tax=Rhizoctonia solani AG-3 Rhs1AP TaxID=1086054 RepID=X8J093_9AGAM|nr:transmembrane protein, putative [Rhizoctonia solani AG-3 Rhs1AP]